MPGPEASRPRLDARRPRAETAKVGLAPLGLGKGELYRLGYRRIGRTTINTILRKHGFKPEPPGDPHSTWANFLRRHASTMGEYAWFAGNMIWPGGGRTYPDGTPVRGVHYHTVGQKKPNAFGLYDMHGGAWEWCADYYDKDYYVNSPLVDPAGPESGRFRTLRGGSWFRYAKYCRNSYRRFFYPACNGDGSIRDALQLEPPARQYRRRTGRLWR